MIKLLLTILSYFGAVGLIIYSFVDRFTHSGLTETELFLRSWPLYVGAIVLLIVCKLASRD
jgi:hypothetical protein